MLTYRIQKLQYKQVIGHTVNLRICLFNMSTISAR